MLKVVCGNCWGGFVVKYMNVYLVFQKFLCWVVVLMLEEMEVILVRFCYMKIEKYLLNVCNYGYGFFFEFYEYFIKMIY